MHEWGFLIAAIFFCLLGNGFFSGSEIALLSAKRGEIEALINQGNHRAVRVKHLQDDPDTLLATVQIGVTLMGTLAGVLGGYLAKLYVEPLLARRVVVRVGDTLYDGSLSSKLLSMRTQAIERTVARFRDSLNKFVTT